MYPNFVRAKTGDMSSRAGQLPPVKRLKGLYGDHLPAPNPVRADGVAAAAAHQSAHRFKDPKRKRRSSSSNSKTASSLKKDRGEAVKGLFQAAEDDDGDKSTSSHRY